ncbi:MAG: phenylacetate--CoA ligase family protein [Armatimonadetes bacterium]|nr:phenylacetate--CoA ligase family protein [Armatimonadota bacterium]
MYLELLAEMRRLNRQQWASADEIEALQLSKLRRQILRAWICSPFYRERFEQLGFQPWDVNSISDLGKLPVVTKAELLAAGGQNVCFDIDPKNCVLLRTSGSSGSPISLPFTRRDKNRRALKELRALFANGYSIRDRMMIQVEPRSMPKKKALPQMLGLLRRSYLSIFAEEREQIDMIRSLRPDVIYGYTSSLRILAERLLTSSEQPLRPKILMTSAEMLDQPTRKLIADAFGTEPIDFYGSMEMGWIAWQCPERRGYHINSDCLIVECLHNGWPAEHGEEGELVITNLHSDAAPLIRYATGDTGVLSDRRCSCGRTLPILESVNGRLADCIVLPDGRKLSPYSLTCAVEDVPDLRQFQIVQQSDKTVRVRLLRGPNEVDTFRVRAAVLSALYGQTGVEVEFVDSLQLERNGKFKVVKSLVGEDVGCRIVSNN